MTIFRLYITGFFCISAFGFSPIRAAQVERVQQFETHVIVNKDASLLVQETITLLSDGRLIKRGITRDFPTRYQLPSGFISNTTFDVHDVRLDGKRVPFRLADHSNGTRMYIGDPNTMLSHGVHTFTITYKTDRQLGFFDKHDELYWSVTGNDTAFPIEYVSVQVDLPDSIPADAIKAEGYTGFFGEKYQNYTASVEKDGVVAFETTRALRPHEGFTIVVTWPKGFVTELSQVTRAMNFIKDNWGLWVLLFGTIAVFLFYIWSYYYVRKDIKRGTIIPLFYPPKKLLPGGVYYSMNMGYSSVVTTADIVNMAVMQALSISYKKKFFSGGRYTLIKKERPDQEQFPLYASLYDTFFSSQEKVVLNSSYASIVQRVISRIKNYYYNQFGSSLFKSGMEYLFIGGVLSALVLSVILFAHISLIWFIPTALLLALINGYFGYNLATYTQEGQKLKEEIEGFKLFLSTTETERLKVIGTPPTRTPELYETYLPYAIALGVEQQWTKQFAPVFARLEQQGIRYEPTWYAGPGQFNAARMSYLSSGLNSSIASSVISASSSVPGSSSGSGGGGSSGGGGGGGGVGGW